jgi:uncharacterized membrane protein
VTTSERNDWFIVSGLLALSFIPIAAGSIRVWQLGSGAEVTPENARFFTKPLPFILHIFSATLYCVLGAFQFSRSLRRRKLNWHRAAGRMLIPCGLVAALSGIWMAMFYSAGIDPPASFDGPFLYAIRLLVGIAMTLFLCLGSLSVRRRDIAHHRAWMMRSYALGLGAGTQVLTHLPWFMFPSIQGELARTICMGAGWGINLALAQWLISRKLLI